MTSTVRQSLTALCCGRTARCEEARSIMTVKQTLTDLVANDSVSLRSNAEIISYLEARCKKLGLRVKHFPHVDEDGVEKINLVAQTSVCNLPPTDSQAEACATIELA